MDERADVQDADHPVVCEERGPKHRLDPFLAQNRVEDVGPVDVVEDHGPPLRGDSAGKPAPERDPDALLDLFFDPDGRPRDELLGVFVQQQDRAGVGAEDLADSREQHLQQVFELRVREGDVGHHLQALEPPAYRPLGFEQAGVFDCQRRPVRRQLKKLDVVLRERPRLERADVQDAEGLAADEQRDAAQRLDSLLAQDRIEHVRVIDVVEDHGPSLGSDTAGKALSERDADAALDFLFDPHGGAGDQLAPLVVEQEDRAGVGVEELGRPLEQRAQELF